MPHFRPLGPGPVKLTLQIILRARESHLLARTISSTASLTSDLISTVQKAFDAYFAKRIIKNLPSSVTPVDFDGTPNDHLALVRERDAKDAEWAKAAREKDEKWGLYLTSLTHAGEALEVAKRKVQEQGGAGDVKELVDASADVLGPYLGETVSLAVTKTRWEVRH
jgi:cysteinyl-tRNA synthetase